MKTIMCLAVFFCLLISASGQKKPTFSSQNYVGLLHGQEDNSFQFQTINGALYRSWLGGFGIGIDDYRFQSLPVFLSVSRFLHLSKNAVFATMNCGGNFFLKKNSSAPAEVYYSGSGFRPGLYMEGGAGYQLSLKNRDALIFFAGFSQKRLHEKPKGELGIGSNEHLNYQFSRLSLKLGWQFGNN